MKNYKYEVQKKLEVAGCHHLDLPYESKCKNWHGHNWHITIYVGANTLEHDMVVDFKHIKNEIHEKLDHSNLNEVLPGLNPTAENIAEWIANTVNTMREGIDCFRVDVQESDGNTAIYRNIGE